MFTLPSVSYVKSSSTLHRCLVFISACMLLPSNVFNVDIYCLRNRSKYLAVACAKFLVYVFPEIVPFRRRVAFVMFYVYPINHTTLV